MAGDAALAQGSAAPNDGNRAKAAAAKQAMEALLQAVTPLLEAVRLPTTETRRLLLLVGEEAGLLLSVEDGRPRLELSSLADAPDGIDTTVRVDGLETLERLLADRTAAPVLLMRRKIRLEGSVSWLEQLGGAAMADTNLSESLEAEVRGVVTAALRAGLQRPASTSTLPSSCSAMWVPDDASATCMVCGRLFTSFRRRHHCRGCGKLCCDSCAPAPPGRRCSPALGLSQQGLSSLPRLCQSCLPDRLSQSSPGSFLGPGSLAGADLAMSAESLLTSGGGAPPPLQQDSGELQTLKAQLQLLRRSQEEAKQVHIATSVQNLWLATQIIAASIGVLLSCWRYSALCAWLLFLTGLHYFPRSSVRRFTHIFWTAEVAAAVLFFNRSRIRSSKLSPKSEDAAWEEVHSVVARFVVEQMMVLGGFWTKFGQQLSANMLLPVQYLDQLKKLQDRMPAEPVSDVLRTLREEFGAEIAARIHVAEGEQPLGTASIAQVHRGSLREPGSAAPRDVAVKVQHRGVELRFKQDLWAAAVLVQVLAFIDPEGFPDMRPIIRSVREVTLRELDFRAEGANQVRARRAAEEAAVDVLIPEVVPSLVSRRALVMDFVDGVPLSRLSEEMPHVDRDRIVTALVDHYGVQFAVDGHFHADPHPGNLLVERGSGRLAVLDWGMCITLPPNSVKAYARLFYAIASQDLWGVVDGLDKIGVSFKEGEVFEPRFFTNMLRFMLRDSKPISMARQELEEVMMISGDLYTSGPKRYQKSPFEVFTGDLVYIGKAVELLYMVSSQLEVHHPILQTLLRRSFSTLLGVKPAAGSGTPQAAYLPRLYSPDPGRGARSGWASLEQRLRSRLEELYNQGKILGAQLCVLDCSSRTARSGRDASCIAHVAVGVCGWLQQDLVTTSTLFNLLDISKLVVALCLLRLVDRRKLRLHDRLADRWDELARGGGKDITLEHILGHTAGFWWPLPPGVDRLPQLLDVEAMLAAWAKATALEPPGEKQRYHQTAFGYLAAGAARRLAGCDLHDLWQELASDIAARSGGAVSPDDLLARLPAGAGSEGGQRRAAAVCRAISSPDFREIQDQISSISMLALPGEGGGERREEEDLPAAAAAALFGREHLLDISLFGGFREEVASSALPGLQGFATARAVAELLRGVHRGEVLSPGLAKEMQRSRRPPGDHGAAAREVAEALQHVAQIEGFEEWGLGAQLLPPSLWGGRPESAKAWGHISQSGSVALVLPGSQPLAVTLLLNMANPPGSSGCHAVASELLRELAAEG